MMVDVHENSNATVQEQLARIQAPGTFSTRRTSPVGDLRLSVKGVGRIGWPITSVTARRLCRVARPARHGFKDETRLDRRVRDTWEIPKHRVSIDGRTWRNTLRPQLDQIRRDLGLPEGCRLKANLHNLLVYEPGQFFLTHQDSEKTDEMIASLVVILPSDFAGGAMVVEHHDERRIFRGARGKLAFVAFYADCRHQVRPVTQGYRVALTYNLTLEGDAAAGVVAPPEQVDALTQAVRRFFNTPRPPRWSHDTPGEPPDRLVYLLDHEYTRRGLAWSRLKNADAARGAVLREVTRRLDCEIFLALVDVHEIWGCEEEDFGYESYGRRWGWRDRRWGWGHGEDEVERRLRRTVTPALVDLQDSDVELRHWVGTGGRPDGIDSRVDPAELCYTKASVDFEPFASEYEGYMGNWGNTVERWYHRAAVVLWPRERTFVIRAKMSARWAIGEVASALRRRDGEAARRQAESLRPFWTQVARQDDRRGVFERTLWVAARLDDENLAASLLEPFALTRLTPSAASRLIDLLDRYGLDWCRTALGRWTAGNRPDGDAERGTWLASALPGLCQSLCAATGPAARDLAQWLVTEQWGWLAERWRACREYENPKDTLDELASLASPMLGLLESSLMAGRLDVRDEIVTFSNSADAGAPIGALVHLLRTARTAYGRRARSLGLKPLHEHAVADLTARLAAAPRGPDDWSISTPVRCTCTLCATLTRFLQASDQVRLEWPLAKDQRAHVHRAVESHGLPVSHTTRRSGRPFTLVLVKTDALFQREAAERKVWQSDLRWLARSANVF